MERSKVGLLPIVDERFAATQRRSRDATEVLDQRFRLIDVRLSVGLFPGPARARDEP